MNEATAAVSLETCRCCFYCQKKTIRYAYGSGELPAMYQKNSSRCYNKFGSPTEFIEQQEE
ncbi:hypothetical protein, partial [Paenibacillus apis]|uniref:hypothetical protein n=1 Tax=Paenibacillus apis TaxID=1792174 RepID=UPI00265958A2